MLKHILATLAVSCAITAQAHYIPSDTPTTGTCNVIPFGDAGSATWSNQVYQTIATAADLGNAGGIITGISFAPCGNVVHKNARLRVTLSHVPPAYILQTTFALNLPTPVVVLDISNHTWNLTGNVWNEIGLQTPFVYDGVSDLVMEIIAEGNTNVGATGHHRDIRPRAYATNWTGTPPATGTVATGALKWCLSKCVASVGLYGEGCAGLTHSYNGVPQIGGTTFDALLNGCAPNSAAFLIIGTTNGTPFPIDLTALGFTGCNLYEDILIALPGTSDGAGLATFPLASLLSNRFLNCLKLYTQGANLNTGAPGLLSASNYARLLFGS